MLSQGNFDEVKYEINFIDPNKKILKVVEKDVSEESKKRVVTFGDSDLDEGLLNAEADKILKNLNLPLPSNIKNEKYEVIKSFQKTAERILNVLKKQLEKKANFETKDGISNASPKNKH